MDVNEEKNKIIETNVNSMSNNILGNNFERNIELLCF